jgi:hypothetical protein
LHGSSRSCRPSPRRMPAHIPLSASSSLCSWEQHRARPRSNVLAACWLCPDCKLTANWLYADCQLLHSGNLRTRHAATDNYGFAGRAAIRWHPPRVTSCRLQVLCRPLQPLPTPAGPCRPLQAAHMASRKHSRQLMHSTVSSSNTCSHAHLSISASMVAHGWHGS